MRTASHAALGSGRLRSGAGEGTRTLDTELGKLVLYQLSYARSHQEHEDDSAGFGMGQPHVLVRDAVVAAAARVTVACVDARYGARKARGRASRAAVVIPILLAG